MFRAANVLEFLSFTTEHSKMFKILHFDAYCCFCTSAVVEIYVMQTSSKISSAVAFPKLR